MNSKIRNFEALVRGFGRVAVCLSGGVDSSVLLAYCVRLLGSGNVLAVLGTARYMISSELDFARTVAARFGAECAVADVSVAEITDSNPVDRCYICKRAIFSTACSIAARRGIAAVLDGSNYDDLRESRLGMRAKDECGVRSPFMECGITKAEIRALAAEVGVGECAEKMSATCLMTRFECNRAVSDADLRRVAAVEDFLRGEGFALCRARDFGGAIEIQVVPEMVARLAEGAAARSRLDAFMAAEGIARFGVSKDGYKFGCMQKSAK